jgi:putative ABC transport system substrate-binding protein
MRRRDFLGALGGAAAWPVVARAQQSGRIRRVGVIMSAFEGDEEAQGRAKALELGLQKARWVKNRNIKIDYRYGIANADSIRTSVQDLVGTGPDVILAHTPATLAALQQATRTIPLVFVQVSDPIELGLVTNLAHPSANITGFVLFESSLGGKWVRLLIDAVPHLTQVLVLYGANNPSSESYLRNMQGAISTLGISLIAAPVSNAEEIERAIAAAAVTSKVGLVVLPSPIVTTQREKIIALATLHRIPAIYPFKLFAATGGLMFYGADNIDQWRQAASYVDRLLNGAQPRDLPIQLPTKYELAVNLKAATAIGLTIPRDLLLLADEVIE